MALIFMMDEIKSPPYPTGNTSNVPYNPPGFQPEILDAANSNISCCTNPCYQPDEVIIKPPTAPPPDYEPVARQPIINLGSLSAEELREACLHYASEHCCYGKKFVRDTAITDVVNGCTYHYRLETFAEKRETAQRASPYKGQVIDGPENGPPPNAWDIQIAIPALFFDSKKTVEVPHTAYVKDCWNCTGNRRVRCESCNGFGGSSCGMCSFGRSNNTTCSSCNGSGRTRCIWCSGTGQVKCKTCDGRGRLKHFILLIVTWKNHVGDYISDTSNLPKEKILNVSGRELFKEQQLRVYPVNQCPDPGVNEASGRLITKHQQSYPNELIRMQRQTLRAIPLTKARYQWKQKQGEFYVYGFQNEVYFENYPQKCCCCTCL